MKMFRLLFVCKIAQNFKDESADMCFRWWECEAGKDHCGPDVVWKAKYKFPSWLRHGRDFTVKYASAMIKSFKYMSIGCSSSTKFELSITIQGAYCREVLEVFSSCREIPEIAAAVYWSPDICSATS